MVTIILVSNEETLGYPAYVLHVPKKDDELVSRNIRFKVDKVVHLAWEVPYERPWPPTVYVSRIKDGDVA